MKLLWALLIAAGCGLLGTGLARIAAATGGWKPNYPALFGTIFGIRMAYVFIVWACKRYMEPQRRSC